MGARHKWPPKADRRTIAGFECADGNERRESACRVCGLVKIEIKSPVSGYCLALEWRAPDGAQWRASYTPPCASEGT